MKISKYGGNNFFDHKFDMVFADPPYFLSNNGLSIQNGQIVSANRRFLGIDQEEQFLEISKNRKLEIENPKVSSAYKQKIGGFNDKKEFEFFLAEEPMVEYKTELKFDK